MEPSVSTHLDDILVIIMVTEDKEFGNVVLKLPNCMILGLVKCTAGKWCSTDTRETRIPRTRQTGRG